MVWKQLIDQNDSWQVVPSHVLTLYCIHGKLFPGRYLLYCIHGKLFPGRYLLYCIHGKLFPGRYLLYCIHGKLFPGRYLLSIVSMVSCSQAGTYSIVSMANCYQAGTYCLLCPWQVVPRQLLTPYCIHGKLFPYRNLLCCIHGKLFPDMYLFSIISMASCSQTGTYSLLYPWQVVPRQVLTP